MTDLSCLHNVEAILSKVCAMAMPSIMQPMGQIPNVGAQLNLDFAKRIRYSIDWHTSAYPSAHCSFITAVISIFLNISQDIL